MDAVNGANSVYPLQIDVYKSDGSRQGSEYLGTISYAAVDDQDIVNGSVPIGTVVNGDEIVATATDANGNTSEFSPEMTVGNPTITVSADPVAAGTMSANANNHLLYEAEFAVTGGNTVLDAIAFDIVGTYDATDVTNFTLHLNTTDNIIAGTTTFTASSLASVGSGETLLFNAGGSGLAFSGNDGQTIYVWLTVDIVASPALGVDMQVTATPFSNTTFTLGVKLVMLPLCQHRVQSQSEDYKQSSLIHFTVEQMVIGIHQLLGHKLP